MSIKRLVELLIREEDNPLFNDRYAATWEACRAIGIEPVNIWYEGGKTRLKFQTFGDSDTAMRDSGVRATLKHAQEISSSWVKQ